MIASESWAAEGSGRGWVEFAGFEYRGVERTAVGPGEYRNPILPGFYPDPSVVRVGEEYYVVNSSFAWWPGVPIFRSRDLVKWEQIGHVLDRPSQWNTKEIGVSEGVFAPSIAYHEGTFYMVTTLVQGGGNMYVTAKDPAGPWSDPIWLHEVNGIDPSFFFNDDGKAYVVHNGPPPGDKPLYSGHRAVWIHEFDVKSGKVKAGTDRMIVNGGTDLAKKPIWIEGPHIFKRGGKYYLIAAEGGTGEDHSEVVFRSEGMMGPWVPFEGNPILTQRHLDPGRKDPVTCVGHAQFVETPGGEWWAVFLGCRPYEGKMTNLGRETFLMPVRWEGGWPVVTRGEERVGLVGIRNSKDEIRRTNQIPSTKIEAPNGDLDRARSTSEEGVEWVDRFEGKELRVEWNFLRTPSEKWWSLGATPGSLLVEARGVGLGSKGNPSLIARRQQHTEFSAGTEIVIHRETTDSDAGVVAFQNETHYFFAGVRVRSGEAREVFVERAAGGKEGVENMGRVALPEGVGRVELKVVAKRRLYSFLYRVGGGEWKGIVEGADGSILSTQVAGGFVGTYVGMFARKGE